MTILPPPEESPSAGRSNSEGLSIEIYFFHCGRGDTILVRLPKDPLGHDRLLSTGAVRHSQRNLQIHRREEG